MTADARTEQLCPQPFTIAVPTQQLDLLRHLVELSPLPAPFYEAAHHRYGVTTAWMKAAKHFWLHDFSWHSYQDYLNQYPQFTASINDRADAHAHTIHFVHLRAADPNATPLLLLHGWPGSFAELYPLVPYLREAFHIVIPSLPGFAFSSAPPTNRDFDLTDCAYLMDALMGGLGYGGETGYVVQGGDIGSFVARLLGAKYNACKAVHLNFLMLRQRPEFAAHQGPLGAQDQADVESADRFVAAAGFAYAMMHATRPATMGHMFASSPLALLAWMGEKLDRMDVSDNLKTIVEWVTLWWLTGTGATSLWPYRCLTVAPWPEWWNRILPGEELHINVPLAFSSFPREISPCPERWARLVGKLVMFRRHPKGGHFAAMEQPELLAKDVLAFAAIVRQEEESKAMPVRSLL